MLEINTHLTSYCRKLCFKICLLFCTLSTAALSSGEWSQNTLHKLTLKEKIAQLFIIPVYTDGKKENIEEASSSLMTHKLGGIIFMQGTLASQRSAVDHLQSISSLPLIVSQDSEWGLNMRVKEAPRFPRNLTLGALNDDQLIYKLGREVALQCRATGVHVNFSPVIDINNNPLNPVINDRSFGESSKKVTAFGLQYMLGLQSNGVMACAKHFPGHGDTFVDSHLELPTINKSKQDLLELEWQPFKALIDNGVGGVMLGHICFPLIAGDTPSSISNILIQDCLKNELGFKGLVFTDSLKMKAITEGFDPGYPDLLALIAGNDLIVMSKNFQLGIERILKGVYAGEISESEIDQKVLKVLEFKEQRILNHKAFDSDIDIYSKEAFALKKELFRKSLTLIKNKNVIPLSKEMRTAFVQIGRDVLMRDALELVHAPVEEQMPTETIPFFEALNLEIGMDYFFLPKLASPEDLNRLKKEMSAYDQVVVGIYEMNKYERLNYGLCPSTFDFLTSLNENNKTVYLTLFGSPYSLKHFQDESVILMGYENDEDAQIGAAEILLGKRKAQGHLPVTASSHYPLGYGIN